MEVKRPVKIANAFSISMIGRDPNRSLFDGKDWTGYSLHSAAEDLLFIPIAIEAVRDLIERRGAESYIGHPDTARLVSGILGMEVPFDEQRRSLVLERDDILIVAQYHGPRLPAGAEQLPEGAEINFWAVVHNWVCC